jgi:hypothetical protein
MLDVHSISELASEKILELANECLVERKADAASDYLKALVSRHPRNIKLRFQAAWILRFQEKIPPNQAVIECRDALLRLVVDFPEVKNNVKANSLIFLRLAECCNEVGPKNKALYLYQELAKVLGQPSLLYKSAEICIGLGGAMNDIKSILEEAIKRDPKKYKIGEDLIKKIHGKKSFTTEEINEIEALDNRTGVYARIFDGVTVLNFPDKPHLGGNALEGDPASYAPSAWDYLVNRFCVSSVLDLGSGCGHAAEYFFRKNIKVVAVEGSLHNVQNSVYPALCLDLSKDSVKCQVDLVHCVELVEHVEEKYLKNLIDSLLCGKYIAMTAAHVGQGGHHHVNEQPNEYWVSHLKNAGCDLLQADTQRLRELGAKDGCAWFATNGMIFVNRARQ